MRNRTERVRVLVLLAIVVCVGSAGTSVLSYLASRAQIEHSLSDQALPLTGDNIYSEIQKDLLRPIFISSLMAQDTFVRDWLLAGEQQAEPIVRYLREVKSRYSTVTAFLISDRSSRYYHAEGMRRSVSADNPLDQWFFRVKAQAEPYEINVDYDEVNRNVLTVFINHKVEDFSGNFIAVTGVGLTLDAVATLLDSYQQRFNRQVYFVDPAGKIVLTGSRNTRGFRTLYELPGIGALADQILTVSNEPANLRYRSDNGDVLLNTRYIPELGWYLIVEQQPGDELRPLQRVLWLNLLIGAISAALVLTIALLAVNRYQRKLERLASSDGLTGLPNRQAFNMLLAQALREEARLQQPLSALLIDVDHFKLANDRFGHLAGDQILSGIAELLRRGLRESDVVARWGGEEFVVLLRDCPLSQATQLAEHLRGMVATHGFVLAEKQQITISIGVAQHQLGETADALFARMDVALYQAKAYGRNRVVTASATAPDASESATIASS